MTQIKRLPYLTPSPERISVGEWNLIRQDGIFSIGELLPDWDAAVNIEAVVSVALDVPGIYEDCRISRDAQLRIAALWESHGTVLRGRGDVVDLNLLQPVNKVDLRLFAQGINLAKRVDLIVSLVLVEANTAAPLAPKLPGSLLFLKTKTVILEGEGARFPVEMINFADTHYPSDAGWVLFWDPDNLHQTVLGDIRLYVNSQHERIKRAVSENRPEDFDIREAIRLDVARTLIYGALNNTEFVENPDAFESLSVGAAVRNMLRLYFPQTSFTQLRDNSRQPQSFEPKLQEKLRAFWEE